MTESTADVDTEALHSYLSGELDTEVVGTELLHEALNQSIAISTANEDRAYVLRRPDKLRHTDIINDLDQEYRVLERLADTAIPAPEPVLFCGDESVAGGEFVVTTYLDGETLSVGDVLPERFRDPVSRERVGELLVDALAEIHAVDVDRFDGVCERIPPAEQVERAVGRLDQSERVTGRELRMLRDVGEWLLENAPPNPETAFLHGDFKPGNVFFGGADRPDITGVLDWEATLLGDPRTELGYLLLYWRDEDDPTPSLDELEGQYSDGEAIDYLREVNEHGFCPFASNPGSPSRRELVARYEARSGLPFENHRFYRAHAAFLLATVWEDIHRHQVEAGADPDPPPTVDYMTRVAASIVDGEFPL